MREKIEIKNKETLKSHQNSNDDTTETVKKISMRRIQRHQVRLPMVTRIGHTSHPI